MGIVSVRTYVFPTDFRAGAPSLAVENVVICNLSVFVVVVVVVVEMPIITGVGEIYRGSFPRFRGLFFAVSSRCEIARARAEWLTTPIITTCVPRRRVRSSTPGLLRAASVWFMTPRNGTVAFKRLPYASGSRKLSSANCRDIRFWQPGSYLFSY